MELLFLFSLLCCFILFFWNLHLLDKNEQLNLLLDDYSEQIDEDIRLFNKILEGVQNFENDKKNNN